MVSVIIPNYNHARYLTERIESVLHQTYRNYEVIILDDCSNDNSREIIESYRNHPKISQIIFNETNSGSTFLQWQKGFSVAQGEYIWIAESDDVAEPNFIEEIMKGISSEKDIVLGFSNLDMIDSQSNLIVPFCVSTFQPKPFVTGNYFIRHNMLFGCNILNASSAIFSKQAALAVPNDYMSFRGAGDYLFWIEIARQGKVYKSRDILDHFRQHNQKVTPNSVASGLQFKEVHTIYKRLKQLGYINRFNSIPVVGFWLHRIEWEKDKFTSNEIYKNCRNLWIKENPFPRLSKLVYLINGVYRTIMKKAFGYAR